jgi:hypothetical protein
VNFAIILPSFNNIKALPIDATFSWNNTLSIETLIVEVWSEFIPRAPGVPLVYLFRTNAESNILRLEVPLSSTISAAHKLFTNVVFFKEIVDLIKLRTIMAFPQVPVTILFESKTECLHVSAARPVTYAAPSEPSFSRNMQVFRVTKFNVD